MRRIMCGTMLAMLLGATALPAAAQSSFRPVVYVNDAAVTNYEINQRVRFMTLLRAPDANAKAAEKALVEDRLKVQAARRMGIAPSKKAIDDGMAEFAGRANLDTASFVAQLGKGGVDEQTFRDFVTSGVAWREVVKRAIAPTVRVSDRDVDQALKQQIETPIVDAVLLSELVIPAPKGQEAQAMAVAQNLTATVRTEAAFAAAARRYSATPTASRGGRLEWTPLSKLPPSLQPIILGLKKNQISQPLSVPGAVVLFFMRDTRGKLRPGATNSNVDYLVMSAPSAAEANSLAARAQSCDDLHVLANRYEPDPITRQTVPASQVPLDVAQRLSSLDDNEATVIDYGAGARVVMLCKRTPALLADGALLAPPDSGAAPAPAADGGRSAPVAPDVAALPSQDAVREEIFNRKITAASEAFLADLRADAIIRRAK